MKPLPERAVIPGAAGKKCRIIPAMAPGRYVLFAGGEMLLDHESPKWLSDSAIGSGALEVRWDFSLVGLG